MTTPWLIFLFLSNQTESENPKDSKQDNTWIVIIDHELNGGLKGEKKLKIKFHQAQS